jgi:hypothetical protein
VADLRFVFENSDISTDLVFGQAIPSERFNNTQFFYSPQITLFLRPVAFQNVQSFYGSDVIQKLGVITSSNSSSFFNHSVIPGQVTISPTRATNVSTFAPARVLPILIPARLENTSVFPSSTVKPLTVWLKPAIDAYEPSFPDPHILTIGIAPIAPNLFENKTVFFNTRATVDQQFSMVWSDDVSYTLPLRNATVTGSTVTVKAVSHHLADGDSIIVTTESGYEQFSVSTTINVIDQNLFSFSLPSVPTIPFPTPKPGQGILIKARFPQYSQMMSFPLKVRVSIPSEAVIGVQTFEEGEWVTQRMLGTTSLTEVVFKNLYDMVRFTKMGGQNQAQLIRTSSPIPVPTNIITIPAESTGGGADLTPVGIPGEYDVVTTNEFGQVIAGENPPIDGGTF